MQLFKFQEEGIAFARTREKCGIFDEMGLGKTVQGLLAAEGRLYVICPAAARISWLRAVKLWAPKRKPLIATHHREFDRENHDTFILSYETATRWQAYVDRLVTLILDEGHYCKTRTSKRTRAIYGRNCDGVGGITGRAKRVIVLTGTPMPNNPSELWPMLRALAPETITTKTGRVMDYWGFVGRYCKTVDNGFGQVIVGAKNLDELKNAMKDFFIRRKIDDVLPDLPGIRFGEIFLSADGIDLKLGVTEQEKRDLLEKLSDETSKLNEPHFAALRRRLGEAKIDQLEELIREELDSGLAKVVIFAHHRSVIEGLRERLGAYAPAIVYGGMGDSEKQAAVDAFQNDKTTRVIIGQIQAMGTNYTLTAAHNIIFAEFSWVPGENAQAAQRCRRIGQTHPTLVRYAVLDGSIDESIQRALARKLEAITQIFN